MRTISKKAQRLILFGSRFTFISLLLSAIGIVVLVMSISDNVSSLPAAVGILFTGIVLFIISIKRAQNILKILLTGRVATGTYEEWTNSYIIFNNRTLVFLIYSFYNDKNKKINVSVLSSNRNALQQVTIIYNDDTNVVLEYLPGKPKIYDHNEIK